MEREWSKDGRESGASGRRSGAFGRVLAGVEVRDEDLEPQTALNVVGLVFRRPPST